MKGLGDCEWLNKYLTGKVYVVQVNICTIEIEALKLGLTIFMLAVTICGVTIFVISL